MDSFVFLNEEDILIDVQNISERTFPSEKRIRGREIIFILKHFRLLGFGGLP